MLELVRFGRLTVPLIHTLPGWEEYHPPKPIGRTTRLALRRRKLTEGSTVVLKGWQTMKQTIFRLSV